ncbi:MAG: ThuA domain-containing protein [Fimbriiglobus sp.]
MRYLLLLTFMVTTGWSLRADDAPMKALIVDGQNNHQWKKTTPILKKILEDSKRFEVAVATSPEKDTAGFRPKFTDHKVVVLNYNGADWPAETKADFLKFVRDGGGVVVVHAADNAFAKWPEYNELIGVGGWGGRTEKDGPYVRVVGGKVTRDETAGRGGSHGSRHEFAVNHIDTEHPITKDLPAKWLHTADELYDRLRGPAKNLTVLAYAHADKAKGGSGENEPMLMTIQFGEGRVFHTTLGHDETAMKCVGFATTLQRGAEWVVTGKVTIPVPKNFPTADKTSPVP